MAAPPPPKGVYGIGRFKVVTAQEAASLATQDSREAHFPARAVLESSNNAEQNCTLRLIGAMLVQGQHRPDPPPPRAAGPAMECMLGEGSCNKCRPN